MNVSAEISLIPIGTDVSLSAYVAACQRVLVGAGLEPDLHANGTNVEGDWDTVMDAVRRCHEAVHAMGVVRISSTVKLNTRTDRNQSLAETVGRVERRMHEE
ncbi:MAG TPA: MTH1187 family thiamine-binding protein [Gammaproteobacteria bacterium]|nr:MTH1187 family thiamine-binding protein [Gammaproteobacteria bacterium]